MSYVIGLDYGTNSVRAIVVRTADGAEIGTSVWNYAHGDAGIIIDSRDTNLARHHPKDYIDGCEAVMKGAVADATKREPGFTAAKIIGIGVDTTGSTPLPVDKEGTPLAFKAEFADNPAACAWLWKDHTSHREAVEITSLAAKIRPQFLAKCGESYSSEWYWSKLLHCARTAPEVFDAAYTWVEVTDWVPAFLTGTESPAKLKRGICAAGHKAMFHTSWGGYPDVEFLVKLDPRLERVRKNLPDVAYSVKDVAGGLTADWAKRTGLPAGVPVAVGAFDAHTGGIGAGIGEGDLVKIIGTSTCDLMAVPFARKMPDIPGVTGVVPEAILPNYHGIEAGQSAVGDIFNWFVNRIAPGGKEMGSHAELTRAAEKLVPGESGLVVLDWHNGNRTVIGDQRLSGVIMGLSLYTTPAEIYRALIEATAFGSRAIMERLEEYGQKVTQIINCGGISVKNPLVMQIYADVMARPIKISRSAQTSALGSAIAGAVVAGKAAGGWDTFEEAMTAMTGTLPEEFHPIPANVAIYEELYRLYMQLHNDFGVKTSPAGASGNYHAMKELLNIKDRVRSGK
ncbi:MAG TPA: ribulokinase [Spirochaetia bacterium]|nr:ribulokinase [Spirochaetia bacterium]